jgi:lipopolysaccharide transport system permease protein
MPPAARDLSSAASPDPRALYNAAVSVARSPASAAGPDRRPADSSPEALPALTVIDAGGTGGGLAELWDHRELLYFLVWRDVKLRYKQTVLGAAWAILQPVLMTAVFYLFFGRLAALEQRVPGIPYAVYALAGLVPWTFFATAVSTASASLVGGAHLITKVYFPRLVIPLGAVGAALVDFAVALPVLGLAMLAAGRAPAFSVVLAPIAVAGLVVVASGVGLALAALTVRYRDFRHVVPFLLQLWLFVTPVIYPVTLIPARWRPLVYLNPVAGLVEAFRAALFGTSLDPTGVALSAAVAVLILAVAVGYFRRVEQDFADVV